MSLVWEGTGAYEGTLDSSIWTWEGQEHWRINEPGGKSLRGGKSLGVGGESSTGACVGHEYGTGTKGG